MPSDSQTQQHNSAKLIFCDLLCGSGSFKSIKSCYNVATYHMILIEDNTDDPGGGPWPTLTLEVTSLEMSWAVSLPVMEGRKVQSRVMSDSTSITCSGFSRHTCTLTISAHTQHSYRYQLSSNVPLHLPTHLYTHYLCTHTIVIPTHCEAHLKRTGQHTHQSFQHTDCEAPEQD